MQSKRDTLPEAAVPSGIVDRAERGSSVPSERVTISSVPKSPEAVTGRRSRVEGDLPARALESLLPCGRDLPVEAGDRAVIRAVVDAIAELLPDSSSAHASSPCTGGRRS